MLKATATKILPTTITGSLPRPSWYTENLNLKSFLDAMVTSRFNNQGGGGWNWILSDLKSLLETGANL